MKPPEPFKLMQAALFYKSFKRTISVQVPPPGMIFIPDVDGAGIRLSEAMKYEPTLNPEPDKDYLAFHLFSVGHDMFDEKVAIYKFVGDNKPVGSR